jgi:hypothetical protein
MKFRVTQPFIAFGKAPEAGEVVELTEEQAKLLEPNDCIMVYETKVMPKPENKAKVGKSSGSSRPARQPRKKTPKSSRKYRKK